MSDETEKPFTKQPFYDLAKLPFSNEVGCADLIYFNLDGEYVARGSYPVPAEASLDEMCELIGQARDRGLSRLHVLINAPGRVPRLLLLKTPPASQP